MYQPRSKAIANLSDFEITELLEVCAEFFGTTLKQSAAGAFIYMLHAKFNFTIDTEILNACTEYAANPSPDFSRKFSPWLLSSILVTKNKSKNPEYKKPESEYDKGFSSEDEKKAYNKQLFMIALYSDFEDFTNIGEIEFNKREVHRVHIWSFVAKKLMDKGIVSKKEYDLCHTENEKLKNNLTDLTDMKKQLKNRYYDICILKFKQIAMEGKHIQQFIN